ncbi:MAG: hypothetical protein ACM3UW_04985 [Bacillota bacterium]
MMPALTKLVVTQSLYDILFQYVLTPEKEQKLLDFINRIQSHLSDNAYRNTPFSVPVEEMRFLEEGLEELKLLCWQEVPVHIFEIGFSVPESSPEFESVKDQVDLILSDLFVYNWQGENRILVYSTIPL